MFSCMLYAGVCAMAPAAEKLYDDYCKKNGCEKPVRGFGFLSLRNPILRHPYQAYLYFLIGVFMMYFCFGKAITTLRPRYLISYVSCILEGFGLLSLLHKIALRGHVQG